MEGLGARCAHALARRVLNENDVLRISICFEKLIGRRHSCLKKIEKFPWLLRRVGRPRVLA